MSKTINEVCDIIFSLEKKHDLNHMKIQGTYPWQLIRIYVYYEIARKIGVFGSPQQRKVTIANKILSFIPFIKNSLFSNPLKGNYHKDILIFDHPRKVLHNNEYKDIYSYFLIDALNSGNHSFEVIESPYLNKHYTKKENYIKYNDRILLGSYFYKKRNTIKFKESEKEKIAIIENEIISNFNIKINLFTIMKNHISNFKYEYKKYDQLFKKRTPKHIFVVVAYENQAMVAAAKDNDVEVLELQHGVISRYHSGYNYPNETSEIEYFPNKILSFGDYWKNVANYPIKSEDVIAIGFPYLEENIESHLNNENTTLKPNNKKNKTQYISKKNKNQIIFISQGVIGKYLSKLAYNIAKKLEKLDENYKIIYKLHPGEYYNWENNYNCLKKAQKLANFKIIDNNEVALYELFSKSEYQVGVFSTAIYEGLVFNCKTFIVDLPGAEYLDDLVENNFVVKIKDEDEFISSLTNFDINSYDKGFFFEKYNEDNLNKIIENNSFYS